MKYQRIKRKLNIGYSILLILCLLWTGIVPASAQEICRVSIPAMIDNLGGMPQIAEKYTIVMYSNEEGNPMPEGTVNGEYAVTIEGNGNGEFVLPFDRVGVYNYTILEQVGDNKDCAYDETVYTLTVTVVNGEEGGLETIAVLYLGQSQEKHASVVFTNHYSFAPEDDEAPEGNEEEEPEGNKEEDSGGSSGGSRGQSGGGTYTSGSTGGSSGKGDGAKTGDDIAIEQWVILWSGAAIAILMLKTSSRRKEE
ncbi:MAG: hypothetical protein HUJ72_08810 [Blautia sp.]|nr:hypothetical protein [Blautia sp.]